MSLDVNTSEPDEFNCNELHSCIKEIAKIKDVEDFSYHVDYVCGKGENFIANIFRVTINENENKNFSVIVKTLINTTRQELFYEIHEREVMAYEDVIKMFGNIQRSINEEERVILPECLYTRKVKAKEVIILEDLKGKGFEINNRLARFEKLGYSQVSAVLKNLAKFHALSFIYEKHYGETFDKVKTKFKDIIFSNSFLMKSKLKDYFHDSFEASLKLVEDLEVRDKLKTVFPTLLEILKKFTKPREPNVLCHGDCWINNVMFQNEDTEDIKVCFIDFQAMRYANPTTDILHFIYLCTDSAFRSVYLEDLFSDYYDNLTSFLSLYNIDVDNIYTREDFNNDIKDIKPFGLLIALIEMKLVTTTPEEDIFSKGSTLVLDEDVGKIWEHDYLKIRVNDVVNESVANGVLDKLLIEINS